MLKTILSISGKPGLFKLISQAKNMLIVESLQTGKRQPAYAHEKIISLGDIAIFTDEEDVPLSFFFFHKIGVPGFDQQVIPTYQFFYIGRIDTFTVEIRQHFRQICTQCFIIGFLDIQCYFRSIFFFFYRIQYFTQKDADVENTAATDDSVNEKEEKSKTKKATKKKAE